VRVLPFARPARIGEDAIAMSRGFTQAACLAICASLLTAAPSGAAPKPVTGKLSKPGYTLVALAADGEGKLVVATPRFSVRPPARRVSLHLVGPDGVYVGPIVVAGRGRRAVVGVKAGTRLGAVRINARDGYGKLEKRLPRKRVDGTRWARAKRGVPLGAGNFGLVRSKAPRQPPLADRDADGVPNPLDIDDDGDRVLDRYERAEARVTAAQAIGSFLGVVTAVNADGTIRGRLCDGGVEATSTWPPDAPEPVVGQSYFVVVESTQDGFRVVSAIGPLAAGCPVGPVDQQYVPRVSSALLLPLRRTVHANASAVSASDLDQVLQQYGVLRVSAPTHSEISVELDCSGGVALPTGGSSRGLSWCSRGGTGRVIPTLIPNSPPRSWPTRFPDDVDFNGNGFGELAPLVREDSFATGVICRPPPSADSTTCVSAFLSPGATTEEIGTGDVLNWRLKRDGGVREFPTTLTDVIATVPALVSYSDGSGEPTQVRYPVQPPFVGSGPGHWGETEGPYEGFPVEPCPADAPPPCVEGEVVLTLTFWRPQREAISDAGEQGQWTDIGGLVYSPGVFACCGPAPPDCQPSALSTTDSNLALAKSPSEILGGYGFRDAAPDRAANPANTLTFSVNVTRCAPQFPPPERGQDFVLWLSGANEASGAVAGNGATQQLLFTVR
jgi:hypothetical protein